MRTLEHRGSSVFYLGENFLVKGVLEPRTEGWVGVHLSEREEGSRGKRNNISEAQRHALCGKG